MTIMLSLINFNIMAKTTNPTILKRIENQKKLFIERLQETLGVISQACERAGINRTTYYAWLEDDEKFREEVEACKELETDFVENCLKKRIKEGDTTAIIFYLKTKGKNRGYSEKIEYSGEMKVDANIQRQLTSKEAQELLNDLKKGNTEI